MGVGAYGLGCARRTTRTRIPPKEGHLGGHILGHAYARLNVVEIDATVSLQPILRVSVAWLVDGSSPSFWEGPSPLYRSVAFLGEGGYEGYAYPPLSKVGVLYPRF